ncbi:hypothetical protein [Streptomyces sp. NBC_00299]|uniref:hypothetical protein n=1 Tax=Streptomyces sp. NBC_00299 TaxID=2975705 RepID=UPI002E294B35|nr:hypothetical protein [Streptomyces sp. NBC_00299]
MRTHTARPWPAGAAANSATPRQALAAAQERGFGTAAGSPAAVPKYAGQERTGDRARAGNDGGEHQRSSPSNGEPDRRHDT